MLGVVILHKSMTERIYFSDEWQKSFIENIHVEELVYNSFEYANGSWTPTRDPSPHMNFDRMFMFSSTDMRGGNNLRSNNIMHCLVCCVGVPLLSTAEPTAEPAVGL